MMNFLNKTGPKNTLAKIGILMVIFAGVVIGYLLFKKDLSKAETKSGAKIRKTIKPLSMADSDSDGFPDAVELKSFDDRKNFGKWFTNIAEMQFYEISEAWNKEQRDCAGLVRFALREALRTHDRLWYVKMGKGYEVSAPDVNAFTLERNPLGEKLFRTDFGAFVDGDQKSKFSEFADARTLKNYNTIFISRDRQQAQPGDLLLFHQPWVQKYPYHAMIFLGEIRHIGDSSDGGGNDWVVYHTGSSSAGSSVDGSGEVKKVRLSILDHHPDKRWRAVLNNRNFLGFYRLKIVD